MTTQTQFAIANFADGSFQPVGPFPHPIQTSVMPVVAIGKGDFRPLGTCFAIHNMGLVLTARHVIDEAWGLAGIRPGEPNDPDTGVAIAALYAARPTGGSEGELIGGPLFAKKICTNNSLDIALMLLGLPTDEQDKLLRMPVMPLSPGLPATGIDCIGLGYHSMTWKVGSESNVIEVAQSLSASKGTIQAVHYPRRDSAMLSFPCFEVASRYDGAMSGGPIIADHGGVIGVICSSIEGQDLIAYGSLIGSALTLTADAKMDDESTQRQFLHDFVRGGSIPVDGTINSIAIERGVRDITLDFGRPPKIYAHLDGTVDRPLQVLSPEALGFRSAAALLNE